MTDDEAILLMVDSNIQREQLLPSEKAFSYKMKLEALNRQGQRTDLTLRHDVVKLNEVEKKEVVSIRQMQRYIRLTHLTKELLELVDQKKISIVHGVDISFFDDEVQGWLYEYILEVGAISGKQIKRLKGESNSENMTRFTIRSILEDEVRCKQCSKKLEISVNKIKKYFPKNYTEQQMEEAILKLLEEWKIK